MEVVGSTRLAETRTSEIATVVTQEQVRFLPQDQRNFLNFAALAPGVHVSNDELKKQVTAGGLDATQINVFIDGVSFKNDILEGGVVGQDSSRGSPFPQSAVEEFAVLTQNYKAEHEKASSAVITAATRSGTNQWTGDLFLFYQDRNLIAQDRFARERDLPKPTYERWQPGASLGGPIVRDKLLVFGAYEENRQDRDSQVTLGGTPVPAEFGLNRVEGTFPSRVPRAAGLCEAHLSAEPRTIDGRELQRAKRGRCAGLRGTNELRGGIGPRQPGRFDPWPMAAPRQCLSERAHAHLPAIELEPASAQSGPGGDRLRGRRFAWGAGIRLRSSRSHGFPCATTIRGMPNGGARTS